VVEAPELPGGFLAACEYLDAGSGLRTRQIVRGDGTVEYSEETPGIAQQNFRFQHMFKDGLGRYFAVGSGSTAQDYGSLHVRDGGGWQEFWLNSGSSGATDLYAGLGIGDAGALFTVGQNGFYAYFPGPGAAVGRKAQLPLTTSEIIRNVWQSPSGRIYAVGEKGYLGSGQPDNVPSTWSMLRRGPVKDFLGAQEVDGGLILVGASELTWTMPGADAGIFLGGGGANWRAVWRSPAGTLYFGGEGGDLRRVPVDTNFPNMGASTWDIWGTSDNDVLFTTGGGLDHWDGTNFETVLALPYQLWKVHGDSTTGEAWAVGDDAGVVFHRANTDAGWQELPGPGYSSQLFGVCRLSNGVAVVVGDNGGVFESKPDGGWIRIPLPADGGSSLFDVAEAPNAGYYVTGGGGLLLHRDRAFSRWDNYSARVETQFERIRRVNGKLWVIGLDGQVFSRPEP
jgi:hypothetical protein